MAYSPTADEILVVWQVEYPSGASHIYAARLKSTTGDIISPPGPMLVPGGDKPPKFPRVATNQKDQYLVVRQVFSPARELWGVRLEELGADGSHSGTMGWDTDADLEQPHVIQKEGSSFDYAVVFEWNDGGDTQVHASYYRSSIGLRTWASVGAHPDWVYQEPSGAAGDNNKLLVYEGVDPDNPAAIRQIYACTLEHTSTTPTYLPAVFG